MVAAILLLFKVLTIRDFHYVHNTGLLGAIECSLWNSELFLWAIFRSSTWNLVTLTFERYVLFLGEVSKQYHCEYRQQ